MLQKADIRRFVRGSLLFERGQPADGVHLVLVGRVALFRAQRCAGRRHQAEIADAGAILGLGETLAEGRHCLAAEALGAVQVAFLSRGRLTELLRSDSATGLQLRHLLVHQIHAIHAAHRILGGPALRTTVRDERAAASQQT